MDWIATLSGWLYFALIAGLLALVFLRKREASAALAWSLAIVFVPIVGALFFVLFGINQVPRRLRLRIARREEFETKEPLPNEFHEFGCEERENDRWGALSRMIVDLGEGPRRAGNAARIFHSGSELIDDVTGVIETAKSHIHIESYILRNDRLGRQIVDQLIARVNAGVEIRLIVDGFGSFAARHLLRAIRRGGGEAVAFTPLLTVGRMSPNLRNHRKIVIVDGRVAFFGGMNVGEEYLGRFGQHEREWYDLHARLEGPAVWDLQRIFVEDWSVATGSTLEGEQYFPPVERRGDATVQIISGGPDLEPNPIRQTILGALTRARRSIFVATPYLVPDFALRQALALAARCGVDVHVATQGWPPDNHLVYFASRYYAEELLESGVHIHAFTTGMMHAKAVCIDGEWAALGSANLDYRSMYLNFEQMAVFDRPEDVETITANLRAVVDRSIEITAETLAARSASSRFASAFARLFAPLL